MTTVTGMTADRMLSIEAASVVDGDVDASGNLILTKHDGSQINAGSVIGPQGPQGPVGSMLSVVTAQPVLDVGVINQIRAGRQLSPADFGNLGLSAPLGLWNLSDLSDASGNGRALQNKGAVGFAPGINGGANTAAQFIGSTAQALYIPDTGANDPFRIRTGSIGCWVRTAKRATAGAVMSKRGTTSGTYGWELTLTSSNVIQIWITPDGSTFQTIASVSDICDDRWHFIVATSDGTTLRLYCDAILEGNVSAGVIFGSSSPFNIGGEAADSLTASTGSLNGRVDEAFITADVLSEDQIRNLYCAKISHTNGAAPARFTLNVRRRRRGAALASSDFPTAPLRLYNFSAGSLGNEGSDGAAGNLTAGNAPAVVAGADGSAGNAYSFLLAQSQNLYGSDASLPTGLASRSYGCWFKGTTYVVAGEVIMWWGPSGSSTRTALSSNGSLMFSSLGDVATGPFICDGLWHFIVGVEDNGALDGVKRKCYVDGKLAITSTVMNAAASGGPTNFRIGIASDATSPLTGQVDGAFVCNYALTAEQIAMLYAKSSQTLTPSPKNPGDHIEAADANNLFAIFDTLDTNAQVDLKVAS